MLKKLLFIDLDDTLFQTLRKCTSEEALFPIAFLIDGAPISFARKSQLALLELFQREMIVVPATARDLDAFRRVRICFPHGAILNYGGVILNRDGLPDSDWHDYVNSKSFGSLSGLEAYQTILERGARNQGLAIRVRIVKDFGVSFYLIAKSSSSSTEDVHKMANIARTALSLMEQSNFQIHINGNNLAILPHWLDKRHAVRHLITKFTAMYGELLTLGMGDSLSDIGFLGECQYLIVPRNSQIANRRLLLK